MKKLFSFVCALLCALSLSAQTQTKTIYLSLGSIDWGKDGASFKEAVSGNNMTPVDGKSGYYQVAIEETQTTVTFQRIGSNGTDVWNKHENLNIPDGKDLYTLTGWDNSGTWSVYSAGGEGEGGNTDPSGTEYWYFDEHNTGWNGTIDNKWKMTVSGDIAYVKVPAGDANKFKIFPCNPKVDPKVLANDDNIAESPLAGDIALSKSTDEWKNILIGKTSADYFVVLYLPNTATNSSSKYLVAAMTQLPNSGSDPTALTNTEVENAVVKVIRNGQVLIVREGVTYNMMGQTIQ